MEVDAHGKGSEQLWSLVEQALTNLDLKWTPDDAMKRGVAFAQDNVWSRSARRKKAREQQGSQDAPNGRDEEDDIHETAALGVAIAIEQSKVTIRWLKGTDHIRFESFSGMLKRALTT